MALQVFVDREGPLLLVRGQGHAGLSELKGFADMIATICRDELRERVLVDLAQVRQELTFTEHLQLGVYIADKLRFLARMATVVPMQERSGNSERAAQKSGLQLRTFTDAGEAREWVLQER